MALLPKLVNFFLNLRSEIEGVAGSFASFFGEDFLSAATFIAHNVSTTSVDILIDWLAGMKFEKECVNLNSSIFVVLFALMLFRDGSDETNVRTRMNNFSGEVNTIMYILRLHNAGKRVRTVKSVSVCSLI